MSMRNTYLSMELMDGGTLAARPAAGPNQRQSGARGDTRLPPITHTRTASFIAT